MKTPLEITLRWLIEELLWEYLHPIWMRNKKKFYRVLDRTSCYPFVVECYPNQLCILTERSEPYYGEELGS